MPSIDPPFNCDDHDLATRVREVIAKRNLTLDFRQSDAVSHLVGDVVKAKRYDLLLDLLDAGMTLSSTAYQEILFWYGRSADFEVLTELLPKHICTDTELLERAARERCWESLNFLIDRKVPVPSHLLESYRDRNQTIKLGLLHDAAWRDVSGTVMRLAKLGLTIDEKDLYERTPLMYACRFGDREYIRGTEHKSPSSAFWLLKFGADPNAMTSFGETPLLLCTSQGNYSACFRDDFRGIIASLSCRLS